MKSLFKIFAAAAAALLFTACSQIDTGNVGVTKTGGKFNAEELTPGWHLTWASTVYEVSAREQLIEFRDITPKTQDQIKIEDMDIDVYYVLNGTKAQEVMTKLAGDLAQDNDDNYVPGFNYVARTAREAIYDAAALVKSSEAQAKRNELTSNVQAMLQKQLDAQFGDGWFTVTNVNLRNLTVDTKLEEKIREAAQVQYQIDAKVKEVKLAEAEADRQRAIAQGEADAATIRAKGLAATQGNQYLRWIELENQRMAIEKWDGVQPTTMIQGGGMPVPTFNINNGINGG